MMERPLSTAFSPLRSGRERGFQLPGGPGRPLLCPQAPRPAGMAGRVAERVAGRRKCRVLDLGNPRKRSSTRTFHCEGRVLLSLKCSSMGRGWGGGSGEDKIWALLGLRSWGRAGGGAVIGGPRRRGTRPAPPVPSLGSEGNSLLLSRSPGCVRRDWADGSGVEPRRGLPRGERRWVVGARVGDPSARGAGGRAASGTAGR